MNATPAVEAEPQEVPVNIERNYVTIKAVTGINEG